MNSNSNFKEQREHHRAGNAPGTSICYLTALVLMLTTGAACRPPAGETTHGGPGAEERAGTEEVRTHGESTAEKLRVDWTSVKDKTVLFITHPSLRVVRSFHYLVKNGILSADSLFVVGLYHADEWIDYSESFSYVSENNVDWLRFEQLDCPLPAEKIFKENKCTEDFKRIFSLAAGMIFTGGPDIPPEIYGRKTLLTTVIRHPHRHYWEISFLSHLIGGSRNPESIPLLEKRTDFPLLGICLGMQSMNIAAGGTMIQDIPSELYAIKTFEEILQQPAAEVHRSAYYFLYPAPSMWFGVFHPIRFTGAHDVWKEMSAPSQDGALKPVNVMSIHHQAVENAGKGLEIIAVSMDGKVVEAIQHEKYPNVLGVQFHPEYDVIWDSTRAARLRKDDDSNTNRFAAELKADKEGLAFHKGFWRFFGNRLDRNKVKSTRESPRNRD